MLYFPVWFFLKQVACLVFHKIATLIARPSKAATTVKRFSEIPGPGPALPVIGTQWMYSKIGPYSLDKLHIANEVIIYVLLGKRMGCLDDHMPPLAERLVSATDILFQTARIPFTNDDPQAVIPDDGDQSTMPRDPSLDSMSSRFTSESSSGPSNDVDINLDEQEEKARLIAQVMELQNTLDDLSQRVDGVKEENLRLRAENQVLGQYIENLMAASSVFQSTSPRTKKK
nr:EOG090X0N2I [Eulimnadia texana]